MTGDESFEVSQLLFAYKRLWIEKQVSSWMLERPSDDSTLIRERVFDIAEAHTQSVEQALAERQLPAGIVQTLVRAFQHLQL